MYCVYCVYCAYGNVYNVYNSPTPSYTLLHPPIPSYTLLHPPIPSRTMRKRYHTTKSRPPLFASMEEWCSIYERFVVYSAPPSPSLSMSLSLPLYPSPYPSPYFSLSISLYPSPPPSLSQVSKYLALVCVVRQEYFEKRSLLDFNIDCFRKSLKQVTTESVVEQV